jgi:hypothetical protein
MTLAKVDDTLLRFAYQGWVTDICRCTNRSKVDELVKLFLAIYPRKDTDEKKTRGAWINAVLVAKVEPGSVLVAALLWRLYNTKFPREVVPPPGIWLKQCGWKTQLPYKAAHCFAELKTAVLEHGNAYDLDNIAADLESPFKILLRLPQQHGERWPDTDWSYARNAFNALVAKGYKPEAIIGQAEQSVKYWTRNGAKLPLLGLWLKRFHLLAGQPTKDQR